MAIPVKLPGANKDVTVRGMAVKHLEILKSAQKAGNVQEALISQVFCNLVDPMDEETFKGLLLGDENVILWALLRASHDDVISLKSQCTHCDHEGDYDVDLTKMKIRGLPETEEPDPENPGEKTILVPGQTEGFIYTMRDGRRVSWHLPRVEERITAETEARNASEAANGAYDFEMTFKLAMHIDHVEGITESVPLEKERRKAIAKWILEQNMNFPRRFMKEVDKHACGVDTAVQIKCTNCHKVYEMEVQLLQCFFTSESPKGEETTSLI